MLTPGSIVFSNYQIVRQVGQGGMGAVYEAINQKLECRVALKQMLVNADQYGEAFRREAMLLARLRHPVLPKVFDYFIEDGTPFLSMEYIAGADLAEMLVQRRGPFPVPYVLGWADALLDALDYLHTQTPSIIHRDIKPQNLKLTDRNEIILLDFGLAKGYAGLNSNTKTAKSVTGYTPQYASLEQINGIGTDARSDLYSLAATLYTLLTGQTPASATSRAAEILAHQPDPLRPIGELNPAIPPKTAGAIMYALGMDPAHRFASASAMKVALQPASVPTVAQNVQTQHAVTAPQTFSPQSPTIVDQPAVDTLKTNKLEEPPAPRTETRTVTRPGPQPAPLPEAQPARRPATNRTLPPPITVSVERSNKGIWIGAMFVILIGIVGGGLFVLSRKSSDNLSASDTSSSNSKSADSAGRNYDAEPQRSLAAASTVIGKGATVGSATYELLGAQLTSGGTKSTLRLKVRMNWGGPYATNLNGDLFRLLVDGQSLTPVEDLNELVESYASKEVIVAFQVPSTATKAALQVGNPKQETEQIPIEFKSAVDQTNAALAGIKAPDWKLPLTLPSGQTADVGHAMYKLLAVQLQHHATGKNVLEFQIRMTNNTSYPTNFWGNRFRLIVNGVPIAPEDPPNEILDKGESKDAKVSFIIPETVTNVGLQVGQVGQETDIIPIDLAKSSR